MELVRTKGSAGALLQVSMELKEGLLPVARAEKDCEVYCPICHKLLYIKAGGVIPRCCGKVMEIIK